MKTWLCWICLYIVPLGIFAQESNDLVPGRSVGCVERGDVRSLKKMIKEGLDVNAAHLARPEKYPLNLLPPQVIGQSLAAEEILSLRLIHVHACFPDAEIFELLLKSGAVLDARDSGGRTALMWALTRPGKGAHVRELIRRGADYLARDAHDNSTMHYAAQGGDPEALSAIKTGGVGINSRNQWGMTPLHVAAQNAPLKTIDYLFELGADLSSQDKFGFNALHYAALSNDLSVVKMLHRKAPQLFTENRNGVNPLDLAYANKNTDIALYFRRQGLNFGGFHYADLLRVLDRPAPDSVLYFLRLGANPNRTGEVAPLVLAAERADLPSMIHLLNYGAELDQQDAQGRNALGLAIEAGSGEIVDFLLRRGAVPESAWLSPLIYALRDDNRAAQLNPVLEAVINKVADVDVPGTELQIPPLHCAAYLGRGDLIRLLLRRGADVKAQDADGWTALHWAIVRRNLRQTDPRKVAAARLLLNAGADPGSISRNPKLLPFTQAYLARRIPANASPFDLLAYALPVDPAMQALFPASVPSYMVAADFYENGKVLREMGLAEPAVVELNKALAREVRLAEGYVERGKAKMALGSYEGARIDFGRALDFRPFYPAAFLEQGRCALELKRFQAAAQYLNEALQQGLRTGEVYFLLGRAYLGMGRTDAACEAFGNSAERKYPGASTAKQLNCGS